MLRSVCACRLVRSGWVLGVVLAASVLALPARAEVDPRSSTVKIITTVRAPDFFRPWNKQPAAEATGTGFVIEGNRILTNAHVVQHARRVLIQPPGSTEKIRAEIEAVAVPIDLAILRIEDEEDADKFFAEHEALTFGETLPRSGDEVEVFGYPSGGDQVSVTEGVVSRVAFGPIEEFQMALVIQIDAAVNPGNSGGPATHGGEVVGVVYSRQQMADNIGFVITAEEVRAFLEDIEDGAYDGREYLSTLYANVENDSLREYLGLPDDVTGVVVQDAGLPHMGELEPWDVITGLGEYNIDSTGTIALREDTRVNFEYLLREMAEDGEVVLDIYRDGQPTTATVPVLRGWDRLMPFLSNDYPRYFIHGPIVFLPAYFGFANGNNAIGLSYRGSPLTNRVLEYKDRPGSDDIEEFVVVLSPFLPHPIVQGYDDPDLHAVKAVNGEKILSLRHLAEVIRDADDEWLKIEWYDTDAQTLVFKTDELADSTEEILEDNGIRDRMSEDLRDLFDE